MVRWKAVRWDEHLVVSMVQMLGVPRAANWADRSAVNLGDLLVAQTDTL